MAKKFILTTMVGKRKFINTFNRVSTIDKYLAGAKDFAKKYKTNEKATIRIQTKEPGKKATKGIIKRIN